MVEHSRYNVSSAATGIIDGVLQNKLGITLQKKLDDTESVLLGDAYMHFFNLQNVGNIVYNLDLIFEIHRYFLSPLYVWAGKVRRINISKNDVLFAPARYIESALKEFEGVLAENVPASSDTKKEVARKLALLHAEFNAIHPFREGNGRTIRLFLDLLAVSAGYELVDYGASSRVSYFAACNAGMAREYSKMERIMYWGLKRK